MGHRVEHTLWWQGRLNPASSPHWLFLSIIGMVPLAFLSVPCFPGVTSPTVCWIQLPYLQMLSLLLELGRVPLIHLP